MSTSQAVVSDIRPRIPLRHVIAVFIGNGLEFYDFLTFSYFAVYISRTFFPPGNPSAALLATLATFGAGFLTRPIGAIVIGGMGDRIGRKPAMIFSFTLMGVAIIGLTLTPSYARIGPAAPIIVLLFRLVQGFALGGEVGPTTAYMAEAAPERRRGLYLSMQYATQDCAVLGAGLIGTFLAAHLSAQQLQDWGWRLAMLIGALIVPFGIAVRRSLPETLPRTPEAAAAVPLAGAASVPVLAAERSRAERVRPFLPIIVFGLMMLTAGTIGSYTLSYMTTYALDTLHLPATISFTLIIINGGFSVMFEALSGLLSDRFGRKPVMIVPMILLIASILPCFWIIGHSKGIWTLYGAEAVMTMFAAVASVPVIVTITETLPPHIRSGAVATIYAFAISIFGGSTQFMLKFLIEKTGNPLAPAYYWTGAAVVGLVAMILVKESAPVRRAA
ncbi:MAG TPA: MFS transporter [Candidatus Sulfotelmatobacter sp.]|nr:MFS transporter [Candidatus Sulfotelmatobacter sp.]